MIAVGLAALALAAWPYLAAAGQADGGRVFSGLLINLQDGNSYLAKMQQGWQGNWFFTLPFTAEQGKPAYLFLYYLFLGHVSRWINLPLVLVYHAARLAGTGVMIYALGRYIVLILGDTLAGRAAFLVAVLGSGVGWLALATGAFTADFWVAEGYPFLSGLVNPHFPLGLGLMLLLLIPNPDGLGSRWWGLARAAFLALLLSLISPFGVVLVLVVKSGEIAWSILQSESIGMRMEQWAVIAAGGLPLLVYDVWITAVDPVLASWNAQNLTPSPPWWDTMLSLSPALLFGLPAIYLSVRRKDRKVVPVAIWAAAGLILMYLPWALQRRFMVGLSVPWVILAAYTLQAIPRPGAQRMLAVAWVILALPTNLITGAAIFGAVARQDRAIYLDGGEQAAFAWILANTQPGSVFLAGEDSGLLIPAWTGRRVIYGHDYETVNAGEKKEAIAAFTVDPGRLFTDPLLKPADFVYASERDGWADLPLDGLAFSPVYENGFVTIYQVDR